MSGGSHVTDNSDNLLITTGGCFITSFVEKCAIFIKIMRVKITDYISQKLRVKEYLP